MKPIKFSVAVSLSSSKTDKEVKSALEKKYNAALTAIRDILGEVDCSMTSSNVQIEDSEKIGVAYFILRASMKPSQKEQIQEIISENSIGMKDVA